MTSAEFRDRMLELERKHVTHRKDRLAVVGDLENWHIDVDHLKDECLRSLGYGDGVDIWEKHGGWYA